MRGCAALLPLVISWTRSAAILGFMVPILLLIHLRLRPIRLRTEAAAFDGFVLVRSQYIPRFGTDPGLTPGAFLGIPVPRSIWPGKPSSAMDTFTDRINPWEYRLTNVGQTTSLPGELTMNWGLIGVSGKRWCWWR